ncbi:MAG: STAS/SEC14 domain-containing protein [Sphingomonas sp.]|nr:STAS/SEC14 domain-containing protein [Sphingomonas sp.]
MLTIDRRDDGVLRILAEGKLTADDLARFEPRFEALARSGPTPMLIELGPDFSGWTPCALWSDLSFDRRHRSQFGRIAIVGDKGWERWGTELTDPLFPGEMRFFDRGASDQAEAWLRGAGGRA